MIDIFLQLLILMGAAHVLCDHQFQQGNMSLAKRPGGVPEFPWQLALGGHALIHGGAVALITGLWWLGAAELVAHAAIDWAKCRRYFGVKVDQALHMGCKILWAGLAVMT